jgi:hypothetical protein
MLRILSVAVKWRFGVTRSMSARKRYEKHLLSPQIDLEIIIVTKYPKSHAEVRRSHHSNLGQWRLELQIDERTQTV